MLIHINIQSRTNVSPLQALRKLRWNREEETKIIKVRYTHVQWRESIDVDWSAVEARVVIVAVRNCAVDTGGQTLNTHP